MSALLKAEEDDVRALCSRCAEGEVLVPANFNCRGRSSSQAPPSALERAEGAWQGRKGADSHGSQPRAASTPPDDAGTRAVFRLPGNRRLQ